MYCADRNLAPMRYVAAKQSTESPAEDVKSAAQFLLISIEDRPQEADISYAKSDIWETRIVTRPRAKLLRLLINSFGSYPLVSRLVPTK